MVLLFLLPLVVVPPLLLLLLLLLVVAVSLVLVPMLARQQQRHSHQQQGHQEKQGQDQHNQRHRAVIGRERMRCWTVMRTGRMMWRWHRRWFWGVLTWPSCGAEGMGARQGGGGRRGGKRGGEGEEVKGVKHRTRSGERMGFA